MARKTLIQVRRDTAANWTAANPVLGAGEPGFESDSGKLKFGDGATAWAALAYFAGTGASVLTTKGDLFGHSTVDARVPVGTDGQLLTADSTQALGVAWKTASATSQVGDGCSVYATGTQSIPGTTHTAILFDAERYDSNGMHSTVSNTSRITAQVAGLYMFTYSLPLASAAGAYSLITALMVNGALTSRYGETQTQATAGAPARNSGAAIIKLAVNDYVEATMWQSTGGAINTEVTASPYRAPMVQAQYVRASA